MVRVFILFFCLHAGLFASTFENQLKLAKNGNAKAMAYVGSNYYVGKIVKQDFEKAFRWLHAGASGGSNMAKNWLSRVYYEGKGAKKNYLASYKWALLSKKAGNKQGAKLVRFLKPKVAHYRKSRLRRLNSTQAYKKAFGLVFAEGFPDELINIYYDDYAKRKIFKYIQRKIKIDYAKSADMVFERVSVKLSSISHTLYALQAIHYFDDESSCKSFMRGYIRNLGAGEIKRAKDSNGNLVKYVDFGVKRSATREDNLYVLNDIDNLKGIRHIVKCSASVGTVEVMDFSSKELAIAEAVEKEPFFDTYFGVDVGVEGDYMKPFGLSLLKPFRQESKNSIKPPKPSSVFSRYSVKTSGLTDTLYGVTAVGSFRDMGRCKVALGSIIEKFIDSYKDKNYEDNQYWNKIYGGISSTFFINENGVIQNPENGIKTTKELLKVRMGCENPKNGSCRGWINIYSEFGRVIASMEDKLLAEDRW